MSTIAMELERTLERLEPEKAKALESRVREAMFEVERFTEPPSLEEMKRRMPEFADLIGSLANMEFDLPPELPLSPAKTW